MIHEARQRAALTRFLAHVSFATGRYCQAALREPWGLRFGPRPSAMIHAVERGQAVVSIGDQRIALRAGDCVLLRESPGHVVHDGSGRFVIDVDFSPEHRTIHEPRPGPPPSNVFVCAELHLQDTHSAVRILPRVLTIRRDEGGPEIESTLAVIAQQAREQQPGSASLVSRLMEVLFVLLVRSWIRTDAQDVHRWLLDLEHADVARAIAAIEAAPEREWTVDALARSVGMSRARFAEMFSQVQGESPMAFVGRVRMNRAAQWLIRSQPVTTVAERLGYSSVSAFARAFKRHKGLSPAAWREAALRDRVPPPKRSRD